MQEMQEETSQPDSEAAGTEETHRAYWRANLRLMGWLLAVWFIVSYGFGILLVEPLNEIRVGGFKLGFWFAQQGSIYVFVALIFLYAWKMNRIDRKFGVDES
jgi:putative solute:sodium symporter small subunit